jgi:hypothetical protein
VPAELRCFFRNVFGKTERSTVKGFLRIIIIVFVFVVLACLPVVPVTTAPVVLNPTYSFRLVTSLKILGFLLTRPDGVSYQWYWYTFAVILALLAVGCLVSVWVFRKLGGSSGS